LREKAFTAIAFGWGSQETNFGNCLFHAAEKRSTSMGHTSWRRLNAPVNSIQSLGSNVDRDSRSAMELNIPGKWEADKEMLRDSHQEVI
jgi:hypothetical protein